VVRAMVDLLKAAIKWDRRSVGCIAFFSLDPNNRG